jgi:hypothetical protein
MVTGYSGSYRGTVVDDTDPLGEQRLLVLVPDVYGDSSAWAAASVTAYGQGLPRVGDLIWITFEHGDTDYPVWSSEEGGGATTDRGFIGVYRATVVDNIDPMQEHRLAVQVPDVDPSPAWATAGRDVGDIAVPDIGAEVWVEYEQGDPAYPRWTGLA